MKTVKNILVILLMTIMFVSCKEKHKKFKVKVYKTAVQHKNKSDATSSSSGTSGASDDFLYWYIMFGNSNTYYSYSSPYPVTDYSSVSWSRSAGAPVGFNEKEAEEQPEQEVETEDVDPDMVDDLADDGVSSYEEDNIETEAESESESDSGSDAGDSGSDGGGGGE
jgi:hypothetical protein